MRTKATPEGRAPSTVAELQARLDEAEEILRAVRDGEVDALVVSGPHGARVYTLDGAEHPYRVMVEAMNQGAVTLTGDGTIFYANRGFAAILDMPLEEVIGSTMSRFVLADDLPCYETLRQHARDGSSNGEVRLNARGGSVVPAYLSISSFESSAPGSVCAVITDLTEHKRNQELIAAQALERTKRAEAEAARQRITSILESITDSFFALDRDWRIIDFNQRAASFRGSLRDETIGQVFWDIFPQARNPEVAHYYDRAMTDRLPVHFELRSAILHGRWFEVHVYPTEEGIAVYFREITERKQAEEELRRSEAYLAEAQRLSHAGSWALNISTGDVFWSPETFRIFGFEPGSVKPSYPLVLQWTHPDDRSSLQHAFDKAIRERSDFDIEVRIVRPDGTIRHVHRLAHPVCNEPGDLIEYVGTIVDITERKQADALLREANARVEMILESITDNFFGFSHDWRFTYLNTHAAEQLRKLGKDPARIIGNVMWDEFPEVPNERSFRRVMAERVPVVDELFYEPLGEWVENHIYPTHDGGVVTVQRYVTERKRAEERLRRSEAYLAEGQRMSHAGTWVWNVSAGELFWSLEHFRICGVDPERFTPTIETARQFIHPEDRPSAIQAFERMTSEGRDFERDFRFVRPDGTIRHVHSSAHPVFNESGDLTEYVGTVIDTTERKEEEEARKELLRRLSVAQEDERRRISREMHDQLGQQLSTLTLKLSALKLEHGRHAHLGEQLASLETMARQLDTDVDFIVWGLRPTALDDLGLAAALADYVNTWSRHFGVDAELHLRGLEPGRLTGEIETALYRILQEALTNIAKHAAARHVDILLEGRADHVSLIVEDDGAGIDEKTVGSGDKRLGVIGMRERAVLLGGTLDIESRRGHGTTVIARIPASEDPARALAR